MAIHCSSSEYQGKAVIVAGNSGAGKSTLTTCLIDHGFRLLTDDVAILKEENQNFRVSPAFPQQKLCRDAVKRNHLEIQDLLYIDEEKDKFALDRKAQFCEEETPLAAMIFLAVHDSDKAVHCRELKGHEKLIHLMQNMFLFPMFRESNAFSPMEMARCLRVAQNVPIYQISRPAGIDSTEEQYRVIIAQCFADKEID